MINFPAGDESKEEKGEEDMIFNDEKLHTFGLAIRLHLYTLRITGLLAI